MSSNSKDVGKNIWYASLSTFIPALFTFLFWFVTAKYVGPEAIGYASTFASISMVLSGFVIFDTNLGMKRYLGIAFAQKDFEQFKLVVVSTIIFILCTICLILIFLMFNFPILIFIGVEQEFIWAIFFLLPILSLQLVFAEALISTLKSKNLIIPQIIGSVIRFPILFLFISFLDSAINATIVAYSVFFVACTILYAVDLYRLLKDYSVQLGKFVITIREILLTGLSSWLPHIISIIGSQLSIISIFAIEGSIEAGKFYLPMAIFTITLFIVTGITRVGHPLVAGMKSENMQRSFVLKSLKLAFMITMPLSTPLLFFPNEYLGILGDQYRTSGGTLFIFMLGLPLSIISEIYYYYQYGLGRKNTLLSLGLSANIPRVILYLLLIPVFGQIGASIAYTIGSAIQLIYSLSLARESNFKLVNSNYIYMIFIPYLIGFLFYLSNITFIISSISIAIISLVLYIRFHFVSDQGIKYALNTLLPSRLARKIIPMVSRIIRLLS